MKVIVINGPMGVGKTTVGKYIADSNPGTAFIDGDWCLDIHPFIGNRETKAMAVDNILHMIGNYSRCSACNMIVLVWLMDNQWVLDSILNGIAGMGLEAVSATLICDRESLIKRWHNDAQCDWRTDEWLEVSMKSLLYFASLENTIDTRVLSVEQVAERIIQLKS